MLISKPLKIILLLFIVSLLGFAAIILIPRHYRVQHLKPRTGISFWHLSTGSRIAYTMYAAKGIKKPYPVIYLHGGPGAGITERELQVYAALADDGYDVYLYDQIGCGRSGRLKNINDYTADRHVKDLQEIVKKISATKVILIGQSWGSILCMLYTADNSNSIDKIIITAPGAIQPGRPELETIAAPDSLGLKQPMVLMGKRNEKTETLRERAIFYFARKFGIKIASDREADEFATFMTTTLNRSMVCDTSNAVIAEGTEGYYVHYMTMKSFAKVRDPRPILTNSQLPVLIMKAQCDNQKWGYTKEYLDLFPNHRLVIVKGAGHNIFLEQPGEYIRLIEEFLEKLKVKS
jgi:proline iminopeptidase